MILTTSAEASSLLSAALAIYPDLAAGGLARGGHSSAHRDPRIRLVSVRLAADWLRALRRTPPGRTPRRLTTDDLLARPARPGWWSSSSGAHGWRPSYGAHHAPASWWRARGLKVPDWYGRAILWDPYVPQGALVAAAVGLGVAHRHAVTDYERVRLLIPDGSRLQRVAEQSPRREFVADLAPEDLA